MLFFITTTTLRNSYVIYEIDEDDLNRMVTYMYDITCTTFSRLLPDINQISEANRDSRTLYFQDRY